MDIIRSGTVVSISSVFTSVLSFLAVILFANLIPAGQLGIFFLFQASLGLLSIVSGFGINGAIEKRISQGETASETLTTAIVLKIGLLIAIVPCIVISHEFVNSYIGIPIYLTLIIGLILQEGSQVSFRTLRGENRVATAALLQLVRTLVWIGGGLIGFQFGFRAQGLIYSLLIGHLIMMLCGFAAQQTTFGKVSEKSLHSLLAYAKHNAITSVGGQIYGWLDTAILGVFVAPGLIAAYEIAWRVSKLGLTLARPVSLTTFPQFSLWAEQGKVDQISSAVSESLIPALMVAIPAFVGIIFLAHDILQVLYGPEYTVAAVAFIILGMERIIMAADHIYSRCLHAIDRPDLSARSTIIAIISNLILNVVLISRFGIVGAAVATSTSFVLKFAIEYHYLNGLLAIAIPRREIGAMTIASTIMGGWLFIIEPATIFSPIATLTISIFSGAVVYFLILSFHAPLRERMLMVAQNIGTAIRAI